MKMMETQKQEGGKDCGLFALAIATAIAYGTDPTGLHFDKTATRIHCKKERAETTCIRVLIECP